jgi:hypothetical protein
MNKFTEANKLDYPIPLQALNNTNKTGSYQDMSQSDKAVLIMNGGAMAAGKTAKLEIMEAQSAAGANAQAIANASVLITANTNVRSVLIALASVANTDTVTINGVTYTKAAATSAASKTFADAAGLVTCINDADNGVAGVTASYSSTNVTVVSDDFNTTKITASGANVAGTVAVSTLDFCGFIEIDVNNLSVNDGYTHVAPKITTTANTSVAAMLVRSSERFLAVEQNGVCAGLVL